MDPQRMNKVHDTYCGKEERSREMKLNRRGVARLLTILSTSHNNAPKRAWWAEGRDVAVPRQWSVVDAVVVFAVALVVVLVISPASEILHFLRIFSF